MPRIPLVIALLLLASATAARAQCMLINPSFEFDGTTGTVFQGWSQFGPVGIATESTHGQRSARVDGPDTGGLDVAGVWQALESGPGDVWDVDVDVRALVALAGGSRALVNVEWRDAGETLLDYVSYDALTSASGTSTTLVVTTPAAPAGTATVRLLLGVLQDAGDPRPTVAFDRARFERRTSPSLDEIQWTDFPGGRSLDFAGRTWRVKGPGFYAPGPNNFADGPQNVWVDAEDRLHVRLRKIGATFYSSELALAEALGYGDYVFTTRGRLDALDPNVVLGLFLWEYGPCWLPFDLWWNPYNEIDVEFSRWGDPAAPNMQYVVQPWDIPGNRHRYDVLFEDDEITSHAFRWLPDRVEWRSWRGGPDDEATSPPIASLALANAFLPRPGRARVHINLWWFDRTPAEEQEVIFEDFRFTPAAVTAADVPPVERRLELTATPNPFNPVTTLAFTLDRAANVTLTIHDARGRHVRKLVDGLRAAGRHAVTWNGFDDRDAPVASGVYHARLSADGDTTSLRMSLIK